MSTLYWTVLYELVVRAYVRAVGMTVAPCVLVVYGVRTRYLIECASLPLGTVRTCSG